MKFKPGDKYIHYTKYGGVNIGTVEQIIELLCQDKTNKVTYYKYSIKNTIGLLIDIDGEDGKVYKVKSIE